jgi:hypothetical protein
MLRGEVLKSRMATENKLAAARSVLTFGLAPSAGLDLDPDVIDVVRSAVLKEGMDWADPDKKPMFSITLRVRSGKTGVTVGQRAWWDYQRAADFIVAKGSLSLTLVDSDGKQYESMSIEAKGVGVNGDQGEADRRLLADYKAKLGKAVAAWLADLGKW